MLEYGPEKPLRVFWSDAKASFDKLFLNIKQPVPVEYTNAKLNK